MDENYQAHLLRLQRNKSTNGWRATMENAHTGETTRFATEQELLRHLVKILTKNDEFEQAGSHHLPAQFLRSPSLTNRAGSGQQGGR